MPYSYYARLRLSASVPEQPELESYLKAFVEFPVFCPKCGPEKNSLKKNGRDHRHSACPQLFFCNRCHTSFYAHTSWLFHQLAKIEWDKILHSLFEDRLEPKAVARLHGVAPSFISRLLHHLKTAVTQRLAEVGAQRTQLPSLPVPLSEALWWGEMFFRLGSTSWCLLLLVNAYGKPMAWKFGKTRTKEDYLELLQRIQPDLPSVPIFIGDGWSAYSKVCKELGRECFLITHLHSHPWEKVQLHHFQPTPDGLRVSQFSLEIPYNSFLQNRPVTGKTFKRYHRLPDPTQPKRKRGRPKGVKDTKKRRSRYSSPVRRRSKRVRKCGPKTLNTDGRGFQFHSTPLLVGWNIEWLTHPLTELNLSNPFIEELELVLDLTYKVMKGGSIQSNRIESTNREIRAIVPNKGLKTPEHTQNYVDHHLYYWKGDFPHSETEELGITPLTPSHAFNRVFTFFTPAVHSLEIEAISF